MVSVERMARVVGRVMCCKRFDDVEFDTGITREAVEGEVGIPCGIVVCCVVYYALYNHTCN
jgi:hypothetical protein